MREKLNNNPLAQVVLIGVLIIAAGVFVMSSGGSEEESASAPSSGSLAESASSAAPAGAGGLPAPGVLAAAAPPLPSAVTTAFAANRTVVLLFVRVGGIDDRKVAATVRSLHALSGVRTFVVPADHIARYAAIAQGVDVNRVPALVVLRPKRLDQGIPSAVVKYGFQSPESVVQAVIDAGYKGPTLDYHP
jgi:hypothetical protein